MGGRRHRRRRALPRQRQDRASLPATPAQRTARDASAIGTANGPGRDRCLIRHPDSLSDDERITRETVLDRSPALRGTRDQVSEFAEILLQRRGHKLHDWMARVGTDGAPALRAFATGLERDLDAVTAGLTLPYKSGPVEWTVNRIK